MSDEIKCPKCGATRGMTEDRYDGGHRYICGCGHEFDVEGWYRDQLRAVNAKIVSLETALFNQPTLAQRIESYEAEIADLKQQIANLTSDQKHSDLRHRSGPPF